MCIQLMRVKDIPCIPPLIFLITTTTAAAAVVFVPSVMRLPLAPILAPAPTILTTAIIPTVVA